MHISKNKSILLIFIFSMFMLGCSQSSEGVEKGRARPLGAPASIRGPEVDRGGPSGPALPAAPLLDALSDRAIESILNQCAEDTKIVNKSTMSSAQAAVFFSDEMQKMDIRKCPPEFRAAFQAHINAWRDAAGAFSQNTPLNAFLEGLESGYFRDGSKYGVSQQKAESALQKINGTYNQLVTIAAAYGARVPKSVIEK